MELTLRRRAIYTGMRPYFDDHELLNAINIWQTEYSHKQKFALSVFVARCCNTPQLKQQRAMILGAIFMAMDSAPAKLLPDPFDELKVSGNLSLDTVHTQDHQTQVFKKLLEQVFMKFNEDDEKQIRNFLIEHLNQIKIDARRLMHIREWLASNTTTLAANYDLDIMQKLINLCYIAMCQFTGPVKADQYLAQAIKETEPLSLKLGFKLHELL